jgi:hypothetical protein
MSQQAIVMKYLAEIHLLMAPTVNTFYESKQIFSKNLSQIARMHEIKLDINRLKFQRYL